MEKNQFNIPTDKWDTLGDQQQTFNRVYGKVIGQKETFLGKLGPNDKNIALNFYDTLVQSIVLTAVTELQLH